MKVLITGATGFLGQWLTHRLIAEGHTVRILKRNSTDLDTLRNLSLDIVVGDVTDRESLLRAAKGMERVYHLAAIVAYTPKERAAMNAVNIGGTENVIWACKENQVKRLLHLSSVVAIGASFTPQPLNEDSAYNLTHLNLGYFETKRKAEELVFEAARKGWFEVVAVNPSTIYGAGDAKKGSRKTQLKVARGEFPFYPPGGVNVVAVEDAVEIIARAADQGINGERYIACGKNLLIKEVFDLIAKESGVKGPSIALPSWAIHGLGKIGDILETFGKKGPMNSENAAVATLYHWFDGSKAWKAFGVQPRPPEYAIAQSLKWIREQGLLSK